MSCHTSPWEFPRPPPPFQFNNFSLINYHSDAGYYIADVRPQVNGHEALGLQLGFLKRSRSLASVSVLRRYLASHLRSDSHLPLLRASSRYLRSLRATAVPTAPPLLGSTPTLFPLISLLRFAPGPVPVPYGWSPDNPPTRPPNARALPEGDPTSSPSVHDILVSRRRSLRSVPYPLSFWS